MGEIKQMPSGNGYLLLFVLHTTVKGSGVEGKTGNSCGTFLSKPHRQTVVKGASNYILWLP